MGYAAFTGFQSPQQLPLLIAPLESDLQMNYGYLREFLDKRWRGVGTNEFLETRANAAAEALALVWNYPAPGSLPAEGGEVEPWLTWLELQQALRPNGNKIITFLAACVRRSDTDWIEQVPSVPGKNLAPQELKTLRVHGPVVPSELTARGEAFLCFGVPQGGAKEKRYRTVYWTIALMVEEDGTVPAPNPPDFLFNVGAFFDDDGIPKTMLTLQDLQGFCSAPWPSDALDSWPAFMAALEVRWKALTGASLTESPLLFGPHVRDLRVELIVRDEIPSPLPELYGRLERMPVLPPLTARLVDGGTPEPVALAGAPREFFLGHMDEAGKSRDSSAEGKRTGFPLDLTQRLAATYAASFGRDAAPVVLPVTGPPGTGKTSFLRAVLASYWVRDAYREAPTPMFVVATGATNKAVSNIIDAFGGVCGSVPGTLQTRWIDGLPSYGWFHPSRSAAKKYPNLMHLSLSGGTVIRSGGAGEFQKSVTENLPGLIDTYLLHAGSFLKRPELTLPLAIKLLHSRLVSMVDEMTAKQSAFRGRLARVSELYRHAQGVKAYRLVQLRSEQRSIERKLQEMHPVLLQGQRVMEHLAHYRDARAREVRGFRRFLPERLKAWFCKEEILVTSARLCELNNALDAFGRFPVGINGSTDQHLLEAEGDVLNIRSEFARLEQACRTLAEEVGSIVARKGAWRELAISVLGQTRITGRPGLEKSTVRHLIAYARGTTTSRSEDFLWHRFDALQDIEYRFPLFHLAARYWEGRWLAGELENRQKNVPRSRHLRRCAMLGVVTVATTHKLPGLIELDEPADVLIVDESGQCLPEVGVAMSALARHLLVVGDTKQLQPIWSCDQSTAEQIALRTLESSPPDELSPAKGSMMLAAQRAASFHDGGDVPGVTLLYHYRCHPYIIGYCNRLLYNGKILPFRLPVANPHRPPMGWVDVQGTPVRGGQSWINEAEAEEIACWLGAGHERLCAEYGDSLDKVVAVLAPLGAQVGLLKSVLERKLVPLVGADVFDAMTIGTVHSLQGAERPVVAFSLVQSTAKGNPTLFANADGGNLMNVAVSRAKEQFIIFGDRHCLRPAPTDPSSASDQPVEALGSYLRRFGTRLYPRQLVIVEAPGKVKRVAAALGKEVEVIATTGNLMTARLVEGRLDWEAASPEFAQRLKPHVALISTVVIATDDDLAGELIGFHVAEIAASVLGKEVQVKRMRFHSTERDELRHSFEAAGFRFDTGLIRAALVRIVLGLADQQEYAEKLPGLPYLSAQRREVMAVMDDRVEPMREVQLQLAPAEGGVPPTKAQLVISSAAAGSPRYVTEEEARELSASLPGVGLDLLTMRSAVQVTPLYPAATTFEVLARIALEMGMPPWEAQPHLNALYQEGGEDDL